MIYTPFRDNGSAPFSIPSPDTVLTLISLENPKAPGGLPAQASHPASDCTYPRHLQTGTIVSIPGGGPLLVCQALVPSSIQNVTPGAQFLLPCNISIFLVEAF